MVQHLRFRRFVPPGVPVYFARSTKQPGGHIPEHNHDFAEVFWIEQGRCRHLINGKRQILDRNDLVLVRPDDIHELRAPIGPNDTGYTLVNVAFTADTLDALRNRYFDMVDEVSPAMTWPWKGGDLPTRFRLSNDQRTHLNDYLQQLARSAPTRLALERFLLNLINLLMDQRVAEKAGRPTMPDWLEEAVQAIHDTPTAMREGVPALVRLAGRSREHVNRTVRQCTGQTSTDLIHRLRLGHAAVELRLSDKPILVIALECGYEHLGHFYRRFKAHYGITPRQYRLRELALTHGGTGFIVHTH